MRIKAAVLHDYNQDFVIEDVELKEPGRGQVLVRIVGCGVCHTDEVVRRGYRTPMPAVLGHEGSGVVEKVGPDVTSVKPGDHVVLSFPYCGRCPNCLSGRPNICYDTAQLCFDGGIYGATPLALPNGKPLSLFFGQSSFATHAVADLSCVVKVEADTDLRLLGPLGCGVQTGAGAIINTFNPQPGSSVAVFGAGSVGLSAVMAAKACGCTKIIAVDVKESRLKLALELGATCVIDSGNVIDDLAAEIRKVAPQGVDYSFDTTGVAACLKGALLSLRRGGSGGGVAIVGAVEVERWSQTFGAKTWRQITEGDSIPQLFIPRLVEMYKAGIFPLDRLVSFYPFEEINDAFRRSHTGEVIKPVLLMN